MEITLGNACTVRHSGIETDRGSIADTEPVSTAAGSQGPSAKQGSTTTSRSRAQASSTLRQNMQEASLRRPHNLPGATAENLAPPSRLREQQQLLEQHGLCLHDGMPCLSETDETALKSALATLTQGETEFGNLWPHLRSAFIWGDKQKIDAVLVMHRLGLIDLKAVSYDGDALVHALAREPFKGYPSDAASTDLGVMSVPERFALLKQAGADFDAMNSSGQRPIEIAMQLQGEEFSTVFAILQSEGVDLYRPNRSSETLLHAAARHGSSCAVNELLQREFDIHATRYGGSNALHLAAQHGAVEVINILLANGAPVDTPRVLGPDAALEGTTALHSAARGGHVMAARLLMDHGAKVDETDWWGNTALQMAAEAGRDDVVMALLDRGAAIDASNERTGTALRRAVCRGHLAVVRTLLDKGASIDAASAPDGTALPFEVPKGKVEVLKALLKKDPNMLTTKNRRQLLIAAAGKGDIAMVDFLLDTGVNIDTRDQSGNTTLHLAVEAGEADLVKMLLNRGADIHAKNISGVNPLDKAVIRGRADVVATLLERDASQDVKDRLYGPAFFGAAIHGRTDIMEMLLEHGADIHRIDSGGLTALAWAAGNGQPATVKSLLELGADTEVPGIFFGDVRRCPTVLSAAAEAGNAEIVELLLANGARVDSHDADRILALLMAAPKCQADAITILLRSGASVDKQDGFGRTALHHAVIKNNVEVVKALLDGGASLTLRGRDNRNAFGLARKHCPRILQDVDLRPASRWGCF